MLFRSLDFAVEPGKTHARGAPAYRHGFARANRLSRPADPGIGSHVRRMRGSSGLVGTTLVLKGYADELREVVAGRDDVYVVEPGGLDYGAIPISSDGVGSIIDHISRHPERESVSRPGEMSREPRELRSELAEFVRTEHSMLDRLDLSGTDGVDTLPPELDYLACEVPDAIASMGEELRLLPLDASARARLRVARDFYLERWQTTLRRLVD